MAEQELQIHPEVDEDVIEISTHIMMDNPLAAKAVELAITGMYECWPKSLLWEPNTIRFVVH